MRKWAAVPVASADVSSHVPAFALLPLEAAAIQSEGNVSVAKTVPVSPAAQFAGADPVRIFNTADALMAVSTASSFAFLTATLYCRATRHRLRCCLPFH